MPRPVVALPIEHVEEMRKAARGSITTELTNGGSGAQRVVMTAPGDWRVLQSLREVAAALHAQFDERLAAGDADGALESALALEEALEAFQLSLGRQEELKLPLPLKDTVALRGQEIFLDDRVGKCNLCHRNAGAN